MKYWFKRRRYGWGWIPVTWQGWTAVIVYLVIVVAGSLMLRGTPEDTFTKELGFYLLYVAIASAALFRISSKYGPEPKWRWGERTDDSPEKDW